MHRDTSFVFDDAAQKSKAKIMVYLKRKEHSSDDATHTPSLARQTGVVEHIAVGSFYEIDHSKLPLKTPEQLKCIRVVMVNDKTHLNVSLRFPSIYSLRAYFANENGVTTGEKKLPALDEKYVMDPEIASLVLFRRIPSQELAEQRNLGAFWVAFSLSSERETVSSPELSTVGGDGSLKSKKGRCWAELKGTGMLQWGKQRKVRFLRRHEENTNDTFSDDNKSQRRVKDLGKIKHYRSDDSEEEAYETEDKDEEEEEEEEEEEGENEAVEIKPRVMRELRKRKFGSSSKTGKVKRMKREQKNTRQHLKISHSKKKIKSNISRWSAERYKLAERNILKVLKEKNAVFGNPILRPALRSEARKLIGDTGLLDHLLKHMAGKVAPGGTDRFRRRHNADGAMEYWLENADLVTIRKEAGVQDPYWTPPPGWKLGDNPTQDPTCAREIRYLKEEMAKMKVEMELRALKKHGEDLALVTTQSSSITSQNPDYYDGLVPLKEMYSELMKKKAKIEEQLIEVSQSLRELEQHMGKIKSAVRERGGEEIAPSSTFRNSTNILSGACKETKEGRENNKIVAAEEGGHQTGENKAAKIERLKSGFRICKPQGTFLWPNMAISPHSQVAVELGDLLLVPTPPSVSSSSKSVSVSPMPLQVQVEDAPRPQSPVKPLAERRAVTVTLSTAAPTHSENTAYNAKIPLLNLNEVPAIISNGTGSNATPTVQQKDQNLAATAIPPHLQGGKREGEMKQTEEAETETKEMARNTEHKQRSFCSSPSPRCL